jgi:hypothetical protein
VISRDVEARSGQGFRSRLQIIKTILYTARLRESDAADPSAGAPRWGAPSVPEKHRQDARKTAKELS